MATQVSLSSIAAHLSEFASKTSASFDKLNASIYHLGEDMKSLRQEVVSLQQSVSFAHDEIDALKQETSTINSGLEQRVIALEEKLLLSELYSKKQNLLFWGVPAETEEDVVEKTYKFMEDNLKVANVKSIAFVNVHRLPKMRGNPVIAKFVSMTDRDLVLRHAYRLQPKSGIGVSVHLPIPIQKAKERLKTAFHDARSKDLKPKFKLDGVTMYLCVAGGKKFKTPEDYFN